MRRFILVAVSSTLLLASCNDQHSPTQPTEPDANALITGCSVTRFPLVQVSALIIKVFPPGKLRNEAVARAGVIAVLWNSCRASSAQKAAVDFVNWMNHNSAKLIGTQEQRNQLINLILSGVGVPATVPEDSPGDFGLGFFDPNATTNTLVKTQNSTALVELEPGSFDEPTTIVLSRKLDGFRLSHFPEKDQYPPFFDYDAINASGNHVLEEGKTAIVGFCLLDSDLVTYPENRRIGHNPVLGAPGYPFEILDPVDLSAEGLAGELNCTKLAPYAAAPPTIGFGGSPWRFAQYAWHNAGYYLGPLAHAVFLPQPLEAATLGTLPPPGGRASSLSPFGVVDPTNAQLSTSISVLNNRFEPSSVTISAGTKVFWNWPTDSRNHNVVPVAPGTEPTASGSPINGPATYEYTFNSPGTYTYQCTVHGPMRGTITVTGVEPTLNHFEWLDWGGASGNPAGQFFLTNSTLVFECPLEGCGTANTAYPGVYLVSPEGTPDLPGEHGIAGVQVTATLVPLDGATGQFTEGSTTIVTSGTGGEAIFDNLQIDEPGKYKITFSAPGATSRTTDIFTVSPPPAPEIRLAGGDLTGDEFVVGETLDGCNGDSCFPEFHVLEGEATIQTPTSLTVTLLGGEGSGILGGTTTRSTSAESPYTAVFNDLTISEPGTYQLQVSAPGVASYTTGSFTVITDPTITLFGVSSFGVDMSKRGSLYAINSQTGVITWIGRLSTNPALYTTATNMAMRPSDQKIFVWSNSPGVLLTVDPTTGLGTPVSETPPPPGSAIHALAYSPQTGILYGIADGPSDGSPSNLLTLDPATGVRTIIGPLGPGLHVTAADFDCDGTLYGVESSSTSQSLVTIDLGTGAATAVTRLSENMPFVHSIVFAPDGTLIGTATNLFDIDPSNGTVSNVRSISATDVAPQGLGVARTCAILR